MASNLININNKGSIEVVKKSSRQVIERYYSRMTLDFHTNKKALEEVAIIPSKRPRNKIAGFSTHLMKQIRKGPVRGISLKLQEEERERRMDFVPEVSAIKSDQIEVDKETMDMLAYLGMSCFPGLVQVDPLLYPLHSSGLEEVVWWVCKERLIMVKAKLCAEITID